MRTARGALKAARIGTTARAWERPTARRWWGSVIACLAAASILAVRPAAGQCGAEVAARLGGEVRAVGRVHDTMLLAGFGSTVRLVNIADPSAPAFVFGLRSAHPSADLEAPAKKIAITPGSSRAFVLDEDGTLTVFSLGSSGLFGPFPNNLGVIGTLNGCVDVVADGAVVYAVRPGGISVYNTAGGTMDFLSNIWPLIDGYQFDRAVKVGLQLWAGFHEVESTIYGVTGYNMLDPDAPVLLTTTLNSVSFDVSEARIEAMTNVGSVLYVAYQNRVDHESSDWVRALDASIPTSPAWLPGFDTGGNVLSMSSIGTQLHLARGGDDLTVWTANDPAALAPLGSYFLQAGIVHDVVSVSGTDYIAGGAAGLQLLNTTNPASITVRSQVGWAPSTPTIVRTTGGDPATVAVLDSTWGYLRLFTTLSPGLQARGVLPLGGSGLMELSVQPGGVYACITSGTNVRIINIDNPDAPASVGSVALPWFPSLMAAWGNRLYVFDQLSQLNVIDLSNPAAPVIRSTTQYGGGSANYNCMTAWTNRVALGTETLGLWFIDTTNAASPLVTSVWNPAPGYRVNAVVNGPTRFYVNASIGNDPFSPISRLEALDISDIVHPALTFRTDAQTGGDPGEALDLAYVGSAAHKYLVATSPSTVVNPYEFDELNGLLRIFDVTNQSVPVRIDGEYLWNVSGRVAPYGVGTRFFVAAGHAGLDDVTSPTQWAPAFISRPHDVTVCFGEDLLLDASAGALGTVSASPPEVTYQWYRANEAIENGPTAWGSTISGATTPTLTIHNPRPEDARSSFGAPEWYSCHATNTCGSGYSGIAYITVCAADVDCNGQTDIFDLLAYLDFWFTGATEADIDGTAGVDVFDLLEFLDGWFTGC